MAHPLRRLALSRRAFLRGSGTAIALPWLDAMVPALRSPAPAPIRTLFVFAPNGVHVANWKPTAGTGDFLSTPTLEPLAPLRRSVTLLTGFELDGGWAHGDGTGDHARAAGSFLTCAHPVKTGGADIRAGVSIDQVIAAAQGAATAFPSLELGMERGASAGICDSGYSCAYSSNVSWRTPQTPVAKETDPRAVFARLFGDPAERLSQEEEERRRRRQRSVLDAALAEVKRLRRDLSPADRAKLEQYTDAVRAIETRLASLEGEEDELRAEVPPDLVERRLAAGSGARSALMYELIALAFETDRTRVATFMLGNAGSNRSHAFLGVPEGHHDLSHHGRDPHKMGQIAKIDRFRIEQLAAFLTRLEETDVGGRSLLDASMVLYGSGISDGNRHNHDDLPILLAGRGGGELRTGRHVELAPKTPLANLYLTMLHVLGIKEHSFADSGGTVDELHA